MTVPSIPATWSSLTWQQLCRVWTAKVCYGGNPDAARCAALLSLCGLAVKCGAGTDAATGEDVYILRGTDRRLCTVTPRQLAYLARTALPWFDYPYGDPGIREEKDETGRVVREGREGVRGLVNPDTGNWHDAMELTEETVCVGGHTFALPQVALNNLTWHQYRALQAIAPQLFAEGVTGDVAIGLQAQFLAYCLVAEQPEKEKPDDAFHPSHVFRYQAERAEASVPFWKKQISASLEDGIVLFHVCFQVYQTAMQNYYPAVYPLLFDAGGKSESLHTALSGEVGTINAIMKYAGYSDQQQVYDTNLPIVFDILNAMTKEAKQVEEMNRKIRTRK